MNSMWFFTIFFHSLGCLEEDSNERQSMEHSSVDEVEAEIQEPTLSVQKQAIVENYPFIQSYETPKELLSLEYYKPTPTGYQRIELNQDIVNLEFAKWLRTVPVLSRNEVYSYKGKILHRRADGIIPLSVGNRDVQQCADSILRIYSEFLWYTEQSSKWGIHFTSGDLSTWKNWSEGERFRIGKKVERYMTDTKDDSYEQYQKWLKHSFLYAGTLSLHKDAIKVPLEDNIQPGDFFLTGGSPGHVVMILDIAQREGSPPIGIVAQGFMPAQEFHIIRGSGKHVVDNWFALPTTEKQALTIPNWKPFRRKDLYRFPPLSKE